MSVFVFQSVLGVKIVLTQIGFFHGCKCNLLKQVCHSSKDTLTHCCTREEKKTSLWKRLIFGVIRVITEHSTSSLVFVHTCAIRVNQVFPVSDALYMGQQAA